jgi:hypothetical protein
MVCPVQRGLIAMNGRVALDFETWIAGCPIHESLFDSWVGYHEPPLTLPAGCPILESLSDSRVGNHKPEPMCEQLDINFFCNAKGLVRYQKCGVFHFLTFSCYRRQPLLAEAGAYTIFERALESVRLRYGFIVAGYVLMPEHVHLLVEEPAVSSLATALQVLK